MLVFVAYYAGAVLLLRNVLIALHVATLDVAQSTITVTPTTTDDRNQTKSTSVHLHVRSVVASSEVHTESPFASQQRSVESDSWYYSRREHKVNEYRHNTLLVPSGLCRRPDTFMLVLVHSSPTNAGRRAAIRVTWGDAVLRGTWPSNASAQQNASSPISRLCMAFVLGLHSDEAVNRAVREEHANCNDIVQGDFIDHYHNMTLKSLLDLKVADERCPGVPYLLKSDDDMIINIPYLLDILTTEPLKRSFMGPYNQGSRVHREGVWKLTLEEFPFSVYPPYESGSAYVITGDLIHELYVTAEYVPHIFVDDVYITGILDRILGVSHVRRAGFAYWGTREPTACDVVRRKIVTGTKMHPQRLCALWNELKLNPTC